MVDPSLAGQAFVACLAGVANYVSITDPSKGRLPDETKEKPIDRLWGSSQKHSIYFKIAFAMRDFSPFASFSQAAYLLYLAFHPKKVQFPTRYATPFFLVSVIGVCWRYWCYRTLDKFFTFHLQVQEGQKIIKTGPYRYIAHPSYLGQTMNAIGIAAATYGPLNVWLNVLSTRKFGSVKMIEKLHFLGNEIVLNNRLLARAVACFIGTSYLFQYFWFIKIRIPDEETMLRKQFGEEYDQFLSQRWRVIPFIY